MAPRARLMSAMAYDRQAWDEGFVADPVIRVLGELPAPSQPFNVNRVYKAPQGRYEESMLLLDPQGRVVHQTPYRFIELRGEMFEDLFRSEVDEDVTIDSADEHAMVFVLDGEEIGRIPVFIDAAESIRTAGVLGDALRTAWKKSDVVWIDIPQRDGTDITRPAWFVAEGDKLYVITGEGEQQLTNLENTDRVGLTVKAKDVKATIAQIEADVRVLDNESDEFTRIATAGMGNRLNLKGGNDALERWRATCRFVELTPRLG